MRPALLLAFLLLGACDRSVVVGHEALASGGEAPVGGGPALLWSAEHEVGTLDEWLADGSGWRYTQGNGTLDVSQAHAHSGGYAVAATISTDDGGMHQAVVARDVTLESGRYGAWYFFPEAMTADYWVIMKLSNGESADRFDIDVHAPEGEEPRLRLFEHGQDWITEPAPVPLAVGRWVHIEALFRSTPDDDGRLIVLQDGKAILDTGPRPTSTDARVSFIVGSVCWHLAGGPYTLYIDDASIEADTIP
jgi:hypothetical protein